MAETAGFSDSQSTPNALNCFDFALINRTRPSGWDAFKSCHFAVIQML